MLAWIADPDLWASLLTLTFLEIVLGIENIIFLSIITERVADALHFHVPRGYLYFAIVFSLLVEILNCAATRKRKKAAERRAAQ